MLYQHFFLSALSQAVAEHSLSQVALTVLLWPTVLSALVAVIISVVKSTATPFQPLSSELLVHSLVAGLAQVELSLSRSSASASSSTLLSSARVILVLGVMGVQSGCRVVHQAKCQVLA